MADSHNILSLGATAIAIGAYAPIAVFAFRRPEHTLRTLQALAVNPEFEHSTLHVFCDGPRRAADEAAVEETRRVVRAFAHPNKTIVSATANQGLAESIIAGVAALCEQYGRVVVVEDDLLVAPTFLSYMNRALNRYADEPQIMQISGHMFPVDLAISVGSVLLPFTTSWGWATWSRAWQLFDASASGARIIEGSVKERVRFDLDGSYPYFRMLQHQLAGQVDSWAIRWYLSVYLRSGLTLFPRASLVENIGFDGSGTHCDVRVSRPANLSTDETLGVEPRGAIATDQDAFMRIKRYLRGQRGTRGLISDWKSRFLPALTRRAMHGQ
jgi:hypothetical protein